jgi:SAM-dependent methyltransferase
MGQTEVFQTEGDEWYKRNKQILSETPDDIVQRYLRTLNLTNCKVLEIGCSSGHRLADLATLGADCYGTEISPLAITEGRKSYPNIHLTIAPSHVVNFDADFFDLVLLNFVLHWVERKYLLTTIAEADRVLKKGGILVVADWYPQEAHRRPYHHNESLNVYTFKQPYWDIWTGSGMYTEIERLPFPHTFASHASGDRGKPDHTLRGSDTDGMMVAFRKDAEDTYPIRDVSTR